MKGTLKGSSTEWYEFTDPDDPDTVWRVHVPFLLSTWSCLYGNGCPGFFGTQEEHIDPDCGCCGHGAYLSSKEERDRVQSYVDQLTEDDLGPKALDHVRKHGWLQVFSETPDKTDPDSLQAKTRVRDKLCVLSNRVNDGGKMGCALGHLGKRLGLDHIDVMPDVCWQLPLLARPVYDTSGDYLATEVIPWDADYWNGEDSDGSHDSWLAWWCVDTPDAYIGKTPLYVTMERELRRLMNDKAYDLLKAYLDDRKTRPVLPMPGTVVNGGRPLLPLIVGNRTPKRVPRNT